MDLLTLARSRGWPVAHTSVVQADDGADAGAFAPHGATLFDMGKKYADLMTLAEVAPATPIRTYRA